jgi:hypothetical protein
VPRPHVPAAPQIDDATFTVVLGDNIKLLERSSNAELAVYLGDVRALLQLTRFLATLRKVFAAFKGSRPFRCAAARRSLLAHQPDLQWLRLPLGAWHGARLAAAGS